MSPDFFVIGSFVVYLMLMLGIGFVFSKKMKNLGDYYLGGRKMNKWLVALSAQASDMSGWLLMGLPGAIFLSGISEAWIGIGLGIGTYLNWKIVAHRLRTYSHACKDSITIPDFICNRFRDPTGLSRIIAALIILLFFTFYTASGFVSCAKLFNSTFGLNYDAALWIGAVVVVAYTLLGGYMAVCWTDFVQGMLMFVAIVLVPSIVIYQSGGFVETVNQLNAIVPQDNSPDGKFLLNLFTNASSGQAIGFVGLLSSLAWGLGYFGMPHILVRFMSIDNPVEVKGSRRIAMTWVFISLGAACVIGVVGHLFLQSHPEFLSSVNYLKEGGFDGEKIFIAMINGLFSEGWLARIFAGILLSAIMAAIMSTSDSQLLVSASSFTNDLYKVVLRNKASNKELLLVSRLTVAVVAIIAAIMASDTGSSFFQVVMSMVSFAWGGFGASFGPLILLALFWRRTNLAGAVSGMVVGAVTCCVWKFGLPAWCPAFVDAHPMMNLYELVPGFALSFISIIVVSLLTKAPSKEILDEFDSVEKNI